ncbi:hypothetical protein HGH93_12270 [Chitinophaga polysaccharea]|uniref:SIR2 family NAD-dependent protein deacylase n=1 Tax=Chitinophaga polysaccharea TaxID=1293035 RepID=UPI001455673B|nr:SIR2 family protein [Chitinophaga polysaccharea]NLR58882.1 hypothetical protein [Chitinophaga polysaccharea]
MDIPKSLIDDIAAGNVVLFLGAGASYGALHPSNESIPLGKTLSNLIAKKFLDDTYIDSDLTTVSEIAISQKSLLDVQMFIRDDVFSKFSPAPHHDLIPTFNWKAIFTVNYDYILELAYDKAKQQKVGIQMLNPIWKNSRQQEIIKPNHVPYFKLHGSFHCVDDDRLPLILTQDQYINHKNNRDGLFDSLKEHANSFTLLFVGFSFSDWDIRAILNKLGTLEMRPRSYMIGPKIRPAEASLWESKKITSLIMPFSDFMNEINKKIGYEYRKIMSSLPKYDLPIFSKFVTSIEEKRPTESLLQFIEKDIEYVHRALPSPNTEPREFYKGYFASWDPIIRNLDVSRSLKDGIISEAFLDEENIISTLPKLYILKGHAGAGKSVMLKRIAWEAGNSFDLFCIFLKSNSQIEYEPLYELYTYVRARIYVFIDQTSSHIHSIERIIINSQKDNIPITILSTERTNVWNTECSSLNKLVEEDFTLKFLNEKEIRELISLLTRHDSLGYLKGKPFEEQMEIFKEKSDRELLVALHEATHGKPFHEIIEDEFNSINDPAAKSLYLTVCILHKLGSYARAGLISRVHGINFNEFKERLFAPLEYIVFTSYNNRIEDYVYKSRHPQIAEMVFETILKEKQEKYDEYIRLITNLNINYSSDKSAFIAITNASELLRLFDDPVKIRNIYDIANEKSVDDPKLFQQQAIFEMKRPNGNFNLAEEYLYKAYKEDSNDAQIAHSFAEFEYKKAEAGKYKVEIFKHLDESKAICLKLIKRHQRDRDKLLHPYHTLLKVELLRLSYVLTNDEGPSFEGIIKDIEKYLSEAKQFFPDEQFLLETESRYNSLLNNEPQAQVTLEKAFEVNKSNPFICLRLSSFYEGQNQIENAIKVCKENLRINAVDKEVNFKVGMLLSKVEPPNYTDILHYLRKSFTTGDTRYYAQFWYARTCFLMKDGPTAKEVFERIGRANISPDVKYKPRGIIKNNGNEVIFTGTIYRKELNYGLLRRDSFGDSILFNIQTEEENWDNLEIFKPVSFKLGFNYKGPLAINLHPLEK